MNNPEIRTIDKEGRVRMLPFLLLRDAKRVVIDRGIQIDDTRNEVQTFIGQLPHVPLIAGKRKAEKIEPIESGQDLNEALANVKEHVAATLDEAPEVYEVPEIAPKRGRKKAQPNQ